MNNIKTILKASAFRSVLMLCAIFLLLVSANVSAQRQNKPVKKKSAIDQNRTPRKTNSQDDTATRGVPSVPVAVVNSTTNDFLSGEVSVSVNPKQPTVIRLGLAQNAVSIVEFPANDGIYYIHEGNPKLASVFQSPTRETDRSITIYPGESFLPSRDNSTAAAISLQMRSGLVIILELVPVTELRKNAHRCVIDYDRDAVIAARRTAGLAYNLGGEASVGPPINSKAVSKLVGGAADTGSTEQPDPSSPNQSNFKAAFIDMTSGQPRRDQKGSKSKKNKDDISVLANKKLAECLKDPKKNFKLWTKPQAGLELSVSQPIEIDEQKRLSVIAIRNSTTSNLRLAPGSPEIQIQTVDAAGNSLQTSRLGLEYVETTTSDGLLPPGSTIYYALVYKVPILGANQSIKVLVAHREAADVPATAGLINTR